jgi:DNA topoisomerase-3
MIGILNEKPSQMRNFEKALGGNRGKFNGEDYVLVAARGHLYEYVDPDKQVSPALAEQYHAWDLKYLPWDEKQFAWKREKKPDTASTLKTIKDVLSKCDEICIATDDDPTGEGELLAWEILDELNLRPKKWSRMYFEDEAESSIQAAFKKRKTIPSMDEDMDYVKAKYRSQWDFMSMQWTRIATRFGDGRTVLRQGRLKSAMVLIVGDGLKAYNEYKKVPSYQNRFKDENGNIFTSKDEPIFPKATDVPKTYHDSDVIVDSKEMRSSAPPKLIDLSTLSSMLAGKGVKAKDVLAVYQKMYEAQVVSYPRTEDKCITKEQFDQLLPKIDAIAKLVGVDTKLLTHRAPRKTHIKDGMAHGANRPGLNVPKSMDDLDRFGSCARDIYTILARNYLAMLGEDYEYEFQKGHLKDYPAFIGTASVPKKMGYKAIFSDMDDEEDTSKGLGTRAKPYVHEIIPPRPPYPTMKWLMKQLEKYDVGTGATRTSTYAEVTNAKSKTALMSESKGKISFTLCGEMSYKLLPGTNIGDLKITEKVMADMKAISQGKANLNECLKDIQRMVREDIETMKSNSATMRKELGVMDNSQKEKYTGTWNGKEVSFNKEWSGHKFTDAECEKLCNGEVIEITAVSKKTGKPFTVKGALAEDTYNGNPFVGFKPDFNSGSVPAEWCKHKFTEDEKILLEQGKIVEADDFVGKKGTAFTTRVRYGEKKDGSKGIIPEFDKENF